MEVTGVPSRRYSPAVARSRRPMMFRSVVLPQPEGPIIMMNSPCLTLRSKSRRAKYSASP